MKISIKELEDLTRKAVKKYGYSDKEVQVIADVLLYAQLRDNNQGVVKLIDKGIPKDPNAGEIVIEKETPISARINGNKNHAMLVVGKAVEIVKEKAKKVRVCHCRDIQHQHIIRSHRLLCFPSGRGGADRICFRPLTAEGCRLRIIRACIRNQSSGRLPFPASRTPSYSICQQPQLPILDW